MDKYISIILEYASGRELDHILAHHYFKEKDTAKLFSQLILGVWYIHQKIIVHCNFKLENLLLNRHQNIIITDFTNSNIMLTISCRPTVDRCAMLLLSSLFQNGSMSALQLTHGPAASFCMLHMLVGYLPLR